MKSLNQKSLICLSLVGSLASLNAAPLASLGDDVALFVTGSARATYQDNLFRLNDDSDAHDADANEDYALVFTPGLELQLADSSTLKSQLNASVAITRYSKSENDGLDSELPSISLNTNYSSGITNIVTKASWREQASNSSEFVDINPGVEELQGRLIEIETTDLSALGTYNFSDRTSVRSGATYQRRIYPGLSLVGNRSVSVPLTFLYEVRPLTQLTATYRYRNTETQNNTFSNSYDDHNFSVGVEGEVLIPTLTGSASIGYQVREADQGRDTDNFSFDAGLSYILTPKATISLNASRDFRNSAVSSTVNGQRIASTIIGTRVGLSGVYTLNSMHRMVGGLTYANSDYEDYDRSQDSVYANIGYRYTPNDYWTFGATYNYEITDGSGINYRDYDSNRLSVSAALRY
ncbi:MAG: outer membrane beta-barrel protein [Verrucomicrobiota bacterium JB022]|nr:outer membrane beta-barrel protein [Verrucomicrobiota bacterium JB022]